MSSLIRRPPALPGLGRLHRHGSVSKDPGVHLARQAVDLACQLGVQFELLLLLDEVVVGLRLLERRLSVLYDLHERRQEDRLEGHDEGELGPRALLEEEHPGAEADCMEVNECHRPRERGDAVRQPEMDVRMPLRVHPIDDRVMRFAGRHRRFLLWTARPVRRKPRQGAPLADPETFGPGPHSSTSPVFTSPDDPRPARKQPSPAVDADSASGNTFAASWAKAKPPTKGDTGRISLPPICDAFSKHGGRMRRPTELGSPGAEAHVCPAARRAGLASRADPRTAL